MLLIGLVLLAAAVALGVDVAVENRALTNVTAFGHTYSMALGNLTAIAIAVGVAGLLALMLMLTAGTRVSRRRREERAAMRERDHLVAQVERERAARTRMSDRRAAAEVPATERRAEPAPVAERTTAVPAAAAEDRAASPATVDLRDTAAEEPAPADAGSGRGGLLHRLRH